MDTKSLAIAPSRDVIQSLDDLLRLSGVLMKSGILPSYVKTPEAAAAIILKGRELHIGPMEAFSGINVIQGKPTIAPQLMLALINRSGQLQDMQVSDNGTTCTVIMTRTGRKPHREDFSMEDAKSMQLAGKDNWTKQPRTMRKWRAISACARVVFPDVIEGMYLPEELGADVIVNDEGETIIDATAMPVETPAQLPEPNGNHAEPQQDEPVYDRHARVGHLRQVVSQARMQGHKIEPLNPSTVNSWDNDKLESSIADFEALLK